MTSVVTPWASELIARRVGRQREVGVRVHVDEARGEDEAIGVEDPIRRRGRAVGRDDRGDPPAVDGDARADPGRARPVDDGRAADEQIGHACRRPLSTGRV